MVEESKQKEKEAEANQLVMQYKVVPVAEHPVFPGIHSGVNALVSISKEQYEMLKEDNVNVVFASVVKND